jgi:hypothetical protein
VEGRRRPRRSHPRGRERGLVLAVGSGVLLAIRSSNARAPAPTTSSPTPDPAKPPPARTPP